MAAAAAKKQVAVKGFKPSKDGFKFPNRFPGIPLPGPLEKLIDTSKSVHGLCGGMVFTVIDHYKARKPVPAVGDIPAEQTSLYKYLATRQLESWGRMQTQVLRYVHWMTFSDEKAQEETLDSWIDAKKRIDEDDFAVLGLVYNDIRESLRVWDNHQVLAYGYTEYDDGSIRIHLYDPNYPKHDDIYVLARQTSVKKAKAGGKLKGMTAAQYRGDKKLHNIHGFLVVPYEFSTPPDLG